MAQYAYAHQDMHSTLAYAQNAQIIHKRVEIKVNAFVLIPTKYLSKILSLVADVPIIPHQVQINPVVFAMKDLLLWMEVASDSLIFNLFYLLFCAFLPIYSIFSH
jgi:hypothetical protein